MYQTIILGCILLTTVYITKRSRDQHLNLPPLVRYKIPLIGHTLSYMFNSEEFFKQCRKEYGDIFSLYIWGKVITFIGKEHIAEVLARDDAFDFGAVFRKRIPGDAMFTNIDGFGDPKYNAKVVKEYISKNLGLYTERMQTCLNSATQKYIGDFDGQKNISNLYNMMTSIISTPIANVFIGEEESKYDDVINTFAEFTRDVAVFFMIPPLFDLIYPGLQDYIIRIPIRLGLFNPATKHEKVLIKHIKNQIDKRLREKKQYGDSWKRPNDILQNFMEEESFDPNNINYAAVANKLCIFIFASVHTTSRGCTNAVIDLASRPEYMQELYEEQLEIRKKADKNGILPFESLKEMKNLDSFIRESLRLTGDIAALPHLALKDFTFSNGLQVPKDRVIDLYFDDVIQDEALQGINPKSFEPFRHLNANVTASKVSKNFVVFGGGKHACPGRFFAINEIKFCMHNFILKYNFRTESGKIAEKMRVGPITYPNTNGIIFEKRIK
ncbi:cytochrome P450 [Glomus cerebriforme]|uniref:Cytochrome P450 n=1 Tax=Glomus cerebriforme TaxID=658196 RepID=A0A397T0U3_9GLOM|nr:cytochrome P450 [Glomus cerebriforme]